MSPSTSNVSTPNESVQLEVSAGDPVTEIFVIDSQFRLVDRGVGHLKTPLNPGIYKIKMKAGNQVHEEHFLVPEGSPDIVRQFEPLTISSAAPLDHSAYSHEFHQDMARTNSQQAHVTLGANSWIYLFVRDWTAQTPPAQRLPGYPHPAQGLTLCDAQGNLLVDYTISGVSNLAWEPCAACNVAVNPGFYRLRLTLPSGNILEQPVVASPGWQTQIFLLQTDYAGPDDAVRRADLAGATIMLSQSRSFDPFSPTARLSELALLGLSNRRHVISDELRQMMLYGKFEDPMLGIFGAYLLLLESKPDRELLGIVLRNLRNLLDAPHPDVEALALHIYPDDASGYRFDYPPMLQRSWGLVLQATVRQPELVPAESLTAQVAGQTWGAGPWLLWMAPATRGAQFPQPAALPNFGETGASPLESLSPPLDERAVAVQEYLSRLYPASSTRPVLDDATTQGLVEMLGLPRGQVEAILDDLYGK